MGPEPGGLAFLWILISGILVVGLEAGGTETSTLTPRPPIFIDGVEAFTSDNGVRSGSGTALDPYIISGWDIDASEAAGVRIEHTTAHFIIRSIRVHSNQQNNGIMLLDVSNGRIENTTIYQNWHGIRLAGVTNLILFNNNISSNQFYGILVPSLDFSPYPSTNMTINGNIVSKNLVGIAVYSSTNSSIVENEISQNSDLGISLYDSERIQVYHNNIVENTFSGNNDPGSPDNQWDNGYPSGGNYWSDYTGTDNCSGPDQTVCDGPDGIGDTPYPLFEQSKDRYPLMSPYDTRFPVWPTDSSLVASLISLTWVTLSWTPASDNMEIASYRVYHEDSLLSIVTGVTLSEDVEGLTPGTVYNFRVEAGDAVGHWTDNGPRVRVTTTVAEPRPGPTPSAGEFRSSFWFGQLSLVLAATAVALITISVIAWAARSGKETEPSL